MAQYSRSEASRGRAMVIGVVLLVLAGVMLGSGIVHHEKGTAGIALFIILIAGLGLYSATH